MVGDGVEYPFTVMVVDGPAQPIELTGVTVMVPVENVFGILAVTGLADALPKVIPPVEVQL